MLSAVIEENSLSDVKLEDLVSRSLFDIGTTLSDGIAGISKSLKKHKLLRTENTANLCRDLSHSVSELSMRLGDYNLDDNQADLSNLIMECRKNLLDCSTALTATITKAKSGDNDGSRKVLLNQVFPLLRTGCVQAMRAIEWLWMNDISCATGHPVLEMLDVLERAPTCNKVILSPFILCSIVIG